MTLQTTIDLDELNARFEDADPRETLEWAFGLGERIRIMMSFQLGGVCLAHMAGDIVDPVPALFIQSGFHFPQTLAYRDRIVDELRLDLVETTPTLGPERQAREIHPELYKVDKDHCCELNKVLPLQRALEDVDGRIDGVRRDQAVTRREVPIVERQVLPSGRAIWKISPLVNWSEPDIWRYARTHDLPVHPLYHQGFASIGCAPCTRAVLDEEDDRAGRWDGSAKLECGIHTFGGTSQEAALKQLES